MDTKYLNIVKKYIEDAVIIWNPDTEYNRGVVDTGSDILEVIEDIVSGNYDDIELEDIEF